MAGERTSETSMLLPFIELITYNNNKLILEYGGFKRIDLIEYLQP